jgi:hypothetical protein
MNLRTERDRQHAHECAEMARSTSDPHIQRSCLTLEKQWLALAKNVEESPLRREITRWMPSGLREKWQ